MFNIAGNLSPPLTVLELPFSRRLQHLSSGPNMLSHYTLEEKKKKTQEVGRDSGCLDYKARWGFFPLSVCRNKMTRRAEVLNCCFSGVTFLKHPFSNLCEMLLDVWRCALLCWVASLVTPLLPHPQPEPAWPFCKQTQERRIWVFQGQNTT